MEHQELRRNCFITEKTDMIVLVRRNAAAF